MMSRVSVPLGTPIDVGQVQASALTIEEKFRTGWLRSAPATPDWLMAAIRSVVAGLGEVTSEEGAAPDPAAAIEAGHKALADIPKPEGKDLDAMIPWILHVVAKATDQPADIIDQLTVPDLLVLFMKLLPGMGALPNFRGSPDAGAATSRGSSTGAPQS